MRGVRAACLRALARGRLRGSGRSGTRGEAPIDPVLNRRGANPGHLPASPADRRTARPVRPLRHCRSVPMIAITALSLAVVPSHCRANGPCTASGRSAHDGHRSVDRSRPAFSPSRIASPAASSSWSSSTRPRPLWRMPSSMSASSMLTSLMPTPPTSHPSSPAAYHQRS